MSDIYAFRVIVETEDDCYRALGLIHRQVALMAQERFKDYHLYAQAEQLPIVAHHGGGAARHAHRTADPHRRVMDRVAEDGVAAHWRYKNKCLRLRRRGGGRGRRARPAGEPAPSGPGARERRRARRMVEHAKLELFLDQVFAFTPKGELITLPQGCHAAGLCLCRPHRGRRHHGRGPDQRRTQADADPELQNGDVVEIVRGRRLSCRTGARWRLPARARSAIRRQIRQTEKEEFQRLGVRGWNRPSFASARSSRTSAWRPALEMFEPRQ
jgi:guanosine-3',5'-bis(diphosphate) 3'-pyrophosphohydrolase